MIRLNDPRFPSIADYARRAMGGDEWAVLKSEPLLDVPGWLAFWRDVDGTILFVGAFKSYRDALASMVPLRREARAETRRLASALGKLS